MPEARAASMRQVNPALIPRNHVVQAALDAAVTQGDLRPFEGLLEVLSKPFESPEGHADWQLYMAPATPEQYVHATYCGT